MAIQLNYDNADCRQQAPHYLYAPKALVAIEHGDEQSRKQGTEADDERRVGGRGVVHRGILRQEIK